MPSFVSDSAFKGTLYPLIGVYFTAAIASFVVAIGLLIPLLIELRNRNGQKSIGRRNTKPVYSTYNLYLVYLSFVDLAFLLPFLVAYWSTANQTIIPHLWTILVRPPPNSDNGFPIEWITPHAYVTANLGINAIIAREIFLLLQSSHRAQRVTQPSLTKVNLQGGAVLFVAVLVQVGFFFEINGYMGAGSAAFLVVYLLLIFGLLVNVIYASIVIKRRGYMPSVNGSSPRDMAVRGLAFYFFRITVVFLAVWLPVGIIFIFLNYDASEISDGPYMFVMLLLMGLQPIITFCMILMKPDVKKYIKDFVTMAYIFEDCTCKNINAMTMGETGRRTAKDTSRPDLLHHPITNETGRRNSVTILGYTFSDVDVENTELDTTANDVLGDSIIVASMVDDNEQDNANEVVDSNNNTVDNDTNVEARGDAKYESRRARRGPAAVVLATGEAVQMDTK